MSEFESNEATSLASFVHVDFFLPIKQIPTNS